MQLNWKISNKDLTQWRSFVAENETNNLVKDRKRKNITRKSVNLSKEVLWIAHVGCQVTTQQRSGPYSAVSKFMASDSNVLKYKECAVSTDVEMLIQSELSKAGLRRSKIIAKNLKQILTGLENDGWDDFIQTLKTIEKSTTKIDERNVANYIARKFSGLGLKQSRNYIQLLGLSRYEIPIDSRITKTMKRLGCTFVPGATALNDETVYLLIQDGMQQIAAKLGMYPCILDACIFSSFDVRNT